MNTTLNPGSLPPKPNPKRTRKPSIAMPRVRKPKDPGILQIDAQAKAAREAYRQSQASEVLLRRIVDTLLQRLTANDRQALYNELSKTETPKLVGAPSDVQQGYIDVMGGALDAARAYGIVKP